MKVLQIIKELLTSSCYVTCSQKIRHKRKKILKPIKKKEKEKNPPTIDKRDLNTIMQKVVLDIHSNGKYYTVFRLKGRGRIYLHMEKKNHLTHFVFINRS